jgi:uncharacterized protein YcbK (DUF882 family)
MHFRTTALAAFVLLIAVVPTARTAGVTPQPPKSAQPESRLKLFHTHTQERLDLVFRRGETYLPEALEQLDRFLRDHRTGEVHHYDPQLFDLLAELTDSVGRPNAEIHIICGYRTPWSNEYLRTHSTGVAQNSLHMKAEAIDITSGRTAPVSRRTAFT